MRKMFFSPNKYAKACSACGSYVAIGMGFISRNLADTAWLTFCVSCAGAQRSSSQPNNGGTAAKDSDPMNGTGAPAPRSLNLEILIKLLKLTTSSNDSEALLAVRKANEQLAKIENCDWETLLRGKVTLIADPFMIDTGASAPSVDSQFTTPRPTPRPAPPPPPKPQAAPPKPQTTCYACGQPIFVLAQRKKGHDFCSSSCMNYIFSTYKMPPQGSTARKKPTLSDL